MLAYVIIYTKKQEKKEVLKKLINLVTLLFLKMS